MTLLTDFELASKSIIELHALHGEASQSFDAAARNAGDSQRSDFSQQHRSRTSNSLDHLGDCGDPACA